MHHALTTSSAVRRLASAVLGSGFALFALGLLDPAHAHACSCMQTTLADAYAAAVAVFEGHVLEVQSVEPSADRPAQRSVRMQVVRSWKGAEGEEVVISTPADSAMCGYAFSADQSYLVFADAQGGGLQVSLCSRTQSIAEAGEDLKAIGMGSTPVDPKKQDTPKAAAEPTAPDEPPARGGCAGCALGAGHGGALGAAPLLALLALLRARSRRRAATPAQ
jgi:hypothetical protein